MVTVTLIDVDKKQVFLSTNKYLSTPRIGEMVIINEKEPITYKNIGKVINTLHTKDDIILYLKIGITHDMGLE